MASVRKRKADAARSDARPETIAATLKRAGGIIQNLTVEELKSVKRYQALQQQIKDEVKSSLGDRYLYRRDEVAELFDVTTRTLSRWIARGEFPRSDNGKWDIREIVRLFQKRIEAKPSDGAATPEDRLRMVKIQREQVRLEVLSGQLVYRDAVVRAAGPRLVEYQSLIRAFVEQAAAMMPAELRAQTRAEWTTRAEQHLKALQEALLHGGADSGTH